MDRLEVYPTGASRNDGELSNRDSKLEPHFGCRSSENSLRNVLAAVSPLLPRFLARQVGREQAHQRRRGRSGTPGALVLTGVKRFEFSHDLHFFRILAASSLHLFLIYVIQPASRYRPIGLVHRTPATSHPHYSTDAAAHSSTSPRLFFFLDRPGWKPGCR